MQSSVVEMVGRWWLSWRSASVVALKNLAGKSLPKGRARRFFVGFVVFQVFLSFLGALASVPQIWGASRRHAALGEAQRHVPYVPDGRLGHLDAVRPEGEVEAVVRGLHDAAMPRDLVLSV